MLITTVGLLLIGNEYATIGITGLLDLVPIIGPAVFYPGDWYCFTSAVVRLLNSADYA